MSSVGQEKISGKRKQYEALRLSLTHIRQLRGLKQYQQDVKPSLGITLKVYLPILMSMWHEYEFSFIFFLPGYVVP